MINTVSVLVSSRIESRDPKNRVALAKDPVAFVARKKLSLWLNTVKSVNPNSKFKKVQNWKKYFAKFEWRWKNNRYRF